jgi:uncharacterized protein YndB with AHSA1/START domain
MSVAAISDRIQQQIHIRAPRSKVWRALITPAQLCEWFRCKLPTAEFRVGERVDGASTYPGHEGKKFFLVVTEISPEHRFVWQWTPGGTEIAGEPHTTVTFELEEVGDGTLLKVTESGFENISIERRAKAFEGNNQGWKLQLGNIRDYVEQNA